MLLVKKIGYLANYFFQNLLYPKALNFRYREILKQNRQLKNIHRGGRCFILGNGPSINSVDLNLLKNDQVFVVNDFIRHPQLEKLNFVNYVMADTAFFNTKSPSDYFGKNLQEKSNRLYKNTKLFLNALGQNLIKERKLFQNQNVYYLSTHGSFNEYFGFNIEIDKTIPFPKNVILACLIIATYMGFETIYLLGVEHNFLTYHFRHDSAKDPKYIYNMKYFYGTVSGSANDAETEQRKLLSQRTLKSTYEAEVARIRQLFKSYRLFYEKVKKISPKTKIYNATPNSYLDVFPYIELKDIKFQ